MKCVFTFFVYCAFSLAGKAQHRNIDSLNKLLPAAREDTNTVHLLHNMSSFYDESNYSDILQFSLHLVRSTKSWATYVSV